ncbi:uncharacterized protein LOC126798364 [Argentina anserina]|uniref:uncharacterized protein LOC126798364 n=1 Tax=Argentina anserina TaxID=57926 RepID=UPI002176431E|nr:uncharacterized protein LOC126798364 [Potentilla anserina]
MSNQQQQPRLHHLKSTSQVLRQASSSFASNLPTFLFLSLLIFSFRSLVENGSLLLTSFLDRDPSLKSLLSRLDLAAASSLDSPLPRRRRPFLHLTRVGTLDDDFFSGDDDHDSRSGRLFSSHPQAPIFIFSRSSTLGFNSSRISSIEHRDRIKDDEYENQDSGEEQEQEQDDDNSDSETENPILGFQFFIKGLELGQRDVAALFFLVSFLSAAYGWVILGFLVTYSWVLGIVFTTVVNDLIGRFTSFIGLVWDGSRLGVKRLSGFILMRWAVRDAFTQLLGWWYFAEIEDQYSFFKLFIRFKLMPFSVMPPWIRGFDKELAGFLFMWMFVDTVVAFVLAVDAWVAIVDSRKSGKEIVKEGLQLVGSMFSQAVKIKCLEVIFCGTFLKWGLTSVFGKSFGKAFQATVEVYFMVAWLVFYFAARAQCRDASSQGDRIGALH